MGQEERMALKAPKESAGPTGDPGHSWSNRREGRVNNFKFTGPLVRDV